MSKKKSVRNFGILKMSLNGVQLSERFFVQAESIPKMKKKVEELFGYKRDAEEDLKPIWEKDYSIKNAYFLYCKRMDTFYYSVVELD